MIMDESGMNLIAMAVLSLWKDNGQNANRTRDPVLSAQDPSIPNLTIKNLTHSLVHYFETVPK